MITEHAGQYTTLSKSALRTAWNPSSIAIDAVVGTVRSNTLHDSVIYLREYFMRQRGMGEKQLQTYGRVVNIFSLISEKKSNQDLLCQVLGLPSFSSGMATRISG